jgi:single-strand DNA-binding protein
VIVTGRQRVIDWARDGKSGTAVEVDAAAVGHDLRFGLSQFRTVLRPGDSPAFFGDPKDAPAEDPLEGVSSRFVRAQRPR